MPTSIGSYLGQNPDYINALAELTARFRKGQSENIFQENEAKYNLDDTLRALGKSYKQAQMGQQGSFAGRGLLNSGLFAKAGSELTNQQIEQVGNTQQKYQRYLSQLARQRAEEKTGYEQAVNRLRGTASQAYVRNLGTY